MKMRVRSRGPMTKPLHRNRQNQSRQQTVALVCDATSLEANHREEDDQKKPDFNCSATWLPGDSDGRPFCRGARDYRNDFYPFVRAELKQHDPVLHDLLEEIWGPIE
jgi:hypothetical protein